MIVCVCLLVCICVCVCVCVRVHKRLVLSIHVQFLCMDVCVHACVVRSSAVGLCLNTNRCVCVCVCARVFGLRIGCGTGPSLGSLGVVVSGEKRRPGHERPRGGPLLCWLAERNATVVNHAASNETNATQTEINTEINTIEESACETRG